MVSRLKGRSIKFTHVASAVDVGKRVVGAETLLVAVVQQLHFHTVGTETSAVIVGSAGAQERTRRRRHVGRLQTRIGSGTSVAAVAQRVREHLEIHDAGQLGGERRQTGASILVRHEDALSVPIVPVHDAFEDGHGKRMQRLAGAFQNLLDVLAVQIGRSDVVVLGVDPVEPFGEKVDRHSVGPLHHWRAHKFLLEIESKPEETDNEKHHSKIDIKNKNIENVTGDVPSRKARQTQGFSDDQSV